MWSFFYFSYSGGRLWLRGRAVLKMEREHVFDIEMTAGLDETKY